MKTRTQGRLAPRKQITAGLCGWLLLSSVSLKATDYIFNATSGTSSWGTTTVWTPNGTPGAGDNIDATLIGSGGATVTLGGTTRTINNLTKTVASRWNISGGAATLSTLNVNNINIATNDMAFIDGSGGGGLQVNAANMTITSGGGLYFGVTSNSASNVVRGLTVSGTTTVSSTGFLRLNVVNISGNSFSLGLLDVSGSGVVTLANAPTGKGATIGNVSGLSGSGGAIQANLAATQRGNVATLAITNVNDYSSATILRDGAALRHGGTLLLTKAGAGTQTLSGANTYTGATTITNGTLRLGHASALGGSSAIVVTNTDSGTNVSGTGTLDLGGQTGVIEVIRLNGTGFGGNGALVNTGAAASIGNGVASITHVAGDTVPTTITISGGGGSGATAALDMGATTSSFTINGGTTVYSSAPTVTISGGGASVNATATAVLTGGVVTGITLTAAGAGYTSAPTISFSGGTVTTAGTNPTGTGNATNFTPVSYNITAAGSGYTSTPTISFGSGAFAATASLSGIVLEGNSSIGGSGDITVDGVVSENGGARVLTKVGTNKLTLANSGNTFSGGTVINSGTVSIASDTALGIAPAAPTPGHLTFNGGTLATTATFELHANRGIALDGSGGTVEVASSTTLTYAGTIDGAGALTKSGAGTLALSTAHTYTGATSVSAGNLTISHASSLGSTSAGTSVSSGATLQLSGGIAIGSEALSLTGDGTATGVGALLSTGGANSWAGNINITAGNTRINSDSGSLILSGNITTAGSGNFNMGGNADIEVSGVISGSLSLFKSSIGAGTLTLSNPGNTYTGNTIIANGVVKVSSEGNLGATPGSFVSNSIRLRGGTLQTTADMSLSATRGVQLSNGGGAFSPDTGTALTVNGVISGTATDTMMKAGNGTLIFTAANTYVGSTQINSGTLQVGSGGSGSTHASNTVSVNGATAVLAGSGMVNGATTVTLGQIRPGDSSGQSEGTLTFANGVAFNHASASTAATLDISGTTSTNDTGDKISITGALTLSGNSNFVVQPTSGGSFTPVTGQSWTLMDWTGLLTLNGWSTGANLRDGSGDSGTNLDLPDISSSGQVWSISDLIDGGSGGLLTITVVVPEPSRALLLFLSLGALLLPRRRRATENNLSPSLCPDPAPPTSIL